MTSKVKIMLGASFMFLFIGGFILEFLWILFALILIIGLSKFINDNNDSKLLKSLGKTLKLDSIYIFFDKSLSSLYNYLPEVLFYTFLLRVPIIGGIFFFIFPLISQFTPAKYFLQNIFVLENGIQLITVMLCASATALVIVSQIKTILVFGPSDTKKAKSFNNSDKFRYIRTICSLALFAPTWGMLLFNNSDINWIYHLIGIILGILLFILVEAYDYRKKIFKPKIKSEENEIKQIRKRRFNFSFFQIFTGFLFYLLVIIFNWPQANGHSMLPDYLQAPTLLYALIIIWELILFVGIIVFLYDKSVDDQLFTQKNLLDPFDSKSFSIDKFKEQSKLLYHTFFWPTLLFIIAFSGIGYGVWDVDHYFELRDSQLPIVNNYEQDFQQAVWNRLCDEKFQEGATQTCKKNNQSQNLAVVAASGGGIQASGWMAQVLTGLQNEKEGIGDNFTRSIGLISSASGGSVGSMFYIDQFNREQKVVSKEALGPAWKNKELSQVVENSTNDWLNSVGWGLAFPDLFRAVGLPIFLNPFSEFGGDKKKHLYLDRGYALEKNWEKTLTLNGEKPQTTLDTRRKQILNGEIPITVYNTTIVENGRPFLVSPMKFVPGTMANYSKELHKENRPNSLPVTVESYSSKILKENPTTALDFKTLYNNCGEQGDQACDLALTTAARLSASFPYVTPMARNDRENVIKLKDVNGKEIPFLQNYHIADGGYYDNAGAFTAMDWLNKFLIYNLENSEHHINIKKIVLLQINAFPVNELQTVQQGNPGYLVDTIGPLSTLAGIRDSTQIGRNQIFVKLLENRWSNDTSNKCVDIQDFTISFPKKNSKNEDYNPPLSWRLTKRQKINLVEAWQNDSTIRETVNEMKKFWNAQERC